jgi:hypothetical protein
MVAKTIRKMHVPAYWPVEFGVQAVEKRGVVVEVKKVIAISLMPIIDVLDGMSMEEAVVAMGMSDIVAVAMSDMDIVIPDMDMALAIEVQRRADSLAVAEFSNRRMIGAAWRSSGVDCLEYVSKLKMKNNVRRTANL